MIKEGGVKVKTKEKIKKREVVKDEKIRNRDKRF
jgi:hypothetical protein